jgi:glycerol-3-phosphate dehydrogenase (NAD(P)+)
VGTERRVAVVGAGSWGTAFGSIAAEKGIETTLWARRADLADAIAARHENPYYLAGVELPDALTATDDLDRALSGAAVVVMAVPSHTFRQNLRDLLDFLPGNAPVVSLVKGIEQDTRMRMSEILHDEGDIGQTRKAPTELAGAFLTEGGSRRAVARPATGSRPRRTRPPFARRCRQPMWTGCRSGSPAMPARGSPAR